MEKTYSEEVKKLAETLKNSGLAASMIDALERAQDILGVNEKVNSARKIAEEENVAKLMNNRSQTTLNNVEKPKNNMEMPKSNFGVLKVSEPSSDVEVSEVDDSEGMKAEEVFTNKPVEPVEKKPNKPEQMKIDLTEIFNVNK